MIRFFRKIRQDLLTNNKLSKYLLYAVGEIILVVLGILIAIQINEGFFEVIHFGLSGPRSTQAGAAG